MHMNPLLPTLVAAICVVLFVGAIARRFGQPHVIAYLIVGVLLGPAGFDLFDESSIALVGEIGVVLLLFFVGMEVDLGRLATRWRVSVVGTGLQVLGSIVAVSAIGFWLEWPWSRVVLLGFAISLSSTALVVTMLQQWDELDTDAGHEALGILLIQDVAIVPMMIVVGIMGDGAAPPISTLVAQLVGGIVIVWLVVRLARGRPIAIPLGRVLRQDHELQVFTAFFLCFACAWLTGAIHLSSPLGAFVAGLVVAGAKETEWIHRNLEPFRVLLVAVFFVSIGMLIDLDFVRENWLAALLLVTAAFLTNTLINAGILRVLGRSWRTSLYVGAILSQVGEFSFILAAIGQQTGIVTEYGYQMVLTVVAGTLILGPAWIMTWRPLRGPSARAG